MSDDIREAGRKLDEFLFRGRHGVGNVGIGSDRLHVYVYGKWHGHKPEKWEGFPVFWNVNIQRPRAQLTT